MRPSLEETNSYTAFSQFCLRTPLFPFSFYIELTQQSEISEIQYRQLLENTLLREAIYLASPELENQLEKWHGGYLTDDKKIDRLKWSLLKYASRISSRCTPFGLFASCALGAFGDTTASEFSSSVTHSRSTRFDMSFLAQIQLELLRDRNIRDHLLFYPNTSLYHIGDHYRYIEYTFQNKRRAYSLEGFSSSEYLQKIIEASSSGKTISELSRLIVEEDITLEEGSDFIHDLIDNQILVSELELTVTGNDYFQQLIEKVKHIPNAETWRVWLSTLQKELQRIDSNIGNSASDYLNIIDVARNTFQDFDTKFLLQTDSFSKLKTNTLDRQLIPQLLEAIDLFRKISITPSHKKLDQFKKTFRERYDDAEIPLTTVLDSEVGIPYGNQQYDNSTFLQDVIIARESRNYSEIRWSTFDYVLHQKLVDAATKGEQVIEIFDKDLKNLQGEWNSPDTFSTMIEVITTKDGEKIFINNAGGNSGAYLLGRFAHGDQDLFNHVQDIMDHEQQVQKDRIVAEIVHLPEARTGNILQRANTRDYEICYLGSSALPKSQQILIDDILVSVKSNKVVLRSKRLGKQILPKLTNAHNYRGNPLPIYAFLCDLQNFERPPTIGFSWNASLLQLSHLPRVAYKNLILAKERWVLSVGGLERLLKNEDVISATRKWRAKHKIPKLVDFVERDNKLLINLENRDSIEMLYNTVRKRKLFAIEEFLFEESASEIGADFRCNQYIISFRKSADKE